MSSTSAPIPFTARNCFRCGREFAVFAHEVTCPTCRQVAHQPPTKGELLGKALTLREEQVVGLIVEGLSNPEIGVRLHLDRGTIRIYVSRIFAKTGCKNRVLLALRMAGKQTGKHAE